jgi:hypothetical protein
MTRGIGTVQIAASVIFLVLRQAQDEENHCLSVLTLSLSKGEDALTQRFPEAGR